jgi:hypothetical protein
MRIGIKRYLKSFYEYGVGKGKSLRHKFEKHLSMPLHLGIGF